ncbi:MAG TPA: SDR family NAD(P)-dependent oxidoreductase, partial [Geobacteraceae bacterium]
NEATAALLAVISDKTGYPAEMLDLDMGLDSDLGIDSIKRVEILSALQERLPAAPKVTPDQLGTLQTLRQIVDYLGQGGGTFAPAAAPATVGPSADDATAVLLAVISDKTGYPAEMLDLDMSLDADLGIDSIKRVEILAALQERLPAAPKVAPDQLGTLQTLRQIVTYLGQGGGTSVPVAAPVAAGPGADEATAVLLAVISDKTGYPAEMLDLDMSLDADLGIDSIKRVEILSALQERLPAAPKVTPEQLGTLGTLRQIVDYLGASPTSHVSHTSHETKATPAAVPEISASARGGIERSILTAVPLPAEGRPVFSLAASDEIWITDDGAGLATAVAARLEGEGRQARLVAVDAAGLTIPERLGALVIMSPARGSDDAFLLAAFRLLQQAAAPLRRAAQDGGAAVVTVSHLDGRFGLLPGSTLADPLSGGLAALAKTARHEWQGVACKAIDLAADCPEPAEALVAELFTAGPVEVGIAADGRSTLELTPAPFGAEPAQPSLTEGDLVIVSGGARGVTAEVAVALAGSCRPTLALLGRSTPPQPEPAWLAALADDGSIRKALVERAAPGTTPKKIEEEFRAVGANREMLRTLARIEAFGATAVYRAVDIRDPRAVADVVAELRASFGPVRGLIHGAGVLADRLITDKTAEQFERVYATKIAGLRSLLAPLEGDDLRFMALFSSSTGRFGRTGQVDYAVANEVLNKIAQFEARRRPACRVTAINWGPWDGGMVTAALKKVFAGEGVDVIDLSAGADCLLREIATPPGDGVEVVVLGTREEKGATAPAAPARSASLRETATLELSVENYPFIRSHVMNGRAVLPMAMMAEWLAHAALHGNPGLRFHGFNDLRVLKGVTFAATTPCTLRVLAGKAARREAFFCVPVELRGEGDTLHARAEIVLANRLPEGIRSISDLALQPYPHGEAIYTSDRLFHGPALHAIEEVKGCGAEGITAAVKAAPAPSEWIASPLRTSWLTDPLALDASFQLMILWSLERFGAGSLPTAAARYRQFQDQFPREGTDVVVRVTGESAHSASAVMEYLDRQTGKLIARLEGYECVIDDSLREAFRKNHLASGDALQRGAA